MRYSTALSGLLKLALMAFWTCSFSKPISTMLLTAASNSAPVTVIQQLASVTLQESDWYCQNLRKEPPPPVVGAPLGAAAGAGADTAAGAESVVEGVDVVVVAAGVFEAGWSADVLLVLEVDASVVAGAAAFGALG